METAIGTRGGAACVESLLMGESSRFLGCRSPPYESDEGYDAIKFSFRITLRAGRRRVRY